MQRENEELLVELVTVFNRSTGFFIQIKGHGHVQHILKLKRGNTK